MPKKKTKSITELFAGKKLGTTYVSKAHPKPYQLRQFPIKKNTHEERVLYLMNRDGDILTESADVWEEKIG